MPSLNLTFTDAEMESLRAAAAARNLSLKAFAHAAVTDASSAYRERVRAAGEFVASRSVELNERLA